MDIKHNHTSIWNEHSYAVVWTFFDIVPLWDWNENRPFSVLWPLLGFPFAGILSALSQHHHLLGFERAELELHHLVCSVGSTWLHIPGCLVLGEWPHHHGYPGHETFFVQICVFLLPLIISSASVRSILFLSFIVPIFAWNVPFVSPIFLKRYLVFRILLFSSVSLHWSLKKALSLLAILGTLHSAEYIFPFLPYFLLLFFPQLFVKLPQTITLASCIFFFEMVLITASCAVSRTCVHSSSGTLVYQI